MEFESAAALNDPKKMHNKIPVAAAFFAANQTTHFAFGTGTMLVVIGRICMD